MLLKEFAADSLLVRVYDSRQSMGVSAAKDTANKIREILAQKSEVNMIFAAAPSQNEFLSAFIGQSGIDWTKINAFHMDEYLGLDPAAPQGFGNFLRAKLFGRLPFKTVSYLTPDSSNAEAECERYSTLLEQHGADIVCMGIGENGHIAFNDPGVALFNDPVKVKIVELDLKCRQQQVNDGCFTTLELVPKRAMTLTIPALTECKYIFCIVPGPTKTEAVTRVVKGPIDEQCPASVLRRHDNAILYTDRDSAADF